MVTPALWLWAPPPLPTITSISDTSIPLSRRNFLVTSFLIGVWSGTVGKERRRGASWNTESVKTTSSSSNTLTFVDVEPGLITNIFILR